VQIKKATMFFFVLVVVLISSLDKRLGKHEVAASEAIEPSAFSGWLGCSGQI
jgi:hypothetical protein